MANIVNYAINFARQLKQKYKQSLKTAGLTTIDQGIRFLEAKTIKIPYIIVQGYKDHGRNGGFNRQNLENEWMTKTLEHDRDVEFFVDVMDVDETNQSLSAANVTNTFEDEQAIPETDCYRLSKMYAEYVALGETVDNTVITAYIPEGFSLVNTVETDINYKLYYENSDEQRIIFEVKTVYDQDHINVNTEANDMEKIIFDGKTGYYINDNPTHMVFWSNESFYFSIICDTTKNDAIKIAESTRIE